MRNALDDPTPHWSVHTCGEQVALPLLLAAVAAMLAVVQRTWCNQAIT